MSNSSLANYINRLSGNYTSRDDDISKITIHIAKEVGDCYALAELLAASNDTAYHYGIATDGTIGLYVDEQYATYSTGNKENDSKAVNIIVMNSSVNPGSGYPISDATYDALVKLCVDICRRNYILKATYTPSNKKESTFTMHSWFASVDCPGSYVRGKYGSIASEVNRQLRTARTASSESESLKSQSTVAAGAINPYMVTPSDNALNIDYKALRDIGVIGVMLHAGSYFDSEHKPKARYINKNLKQQIAEVKAAELPHALYATVRARTVEEAKKECYELYFVISKYPPKLGLWLNLENTLLGREMAQQIVDVYYEKIVKWGLKAKCGFYCTPSAANKINWPQYTDKFALWLISPLSNVSNLEELLTPTLFKL